MKGLDAPYAAFACPHEPFDDCFASLIAVESARIVIGEFVRQFGSAIAVRSRGLIETLETAVWNTYSFDTVWDSSLGGIQAALSGKNVVDPVERAAALGLRFCLAGASTTWEATISAPVCVRAGPWLLPRGDRLFVESNRTALSVRVHNGHRRSRMEFHWQRRGWSADSLETIPSCNVGGRRVLILPAKALAPDERSWAMPLIDRRRASVAITSVQAACRLLSDASPLYSMWATRLLRQIVPWRAGRNMLNSGSTATSPGVVSLSIGQRAAETAQMMVHEAAHQHMYLLCRLGLLDDGSDRRLHYSPVRRMKRPIGAIIVAYHAAGNEVLFSGAASRVGLPSRSSGSKKRLVWNDCAKWKQHCAAVERLRRWAVRYGSPSPSAF